MNKYLAFIILASCFILLALPSLAAANGGGDRVCIYKHENFQGHEQCYRPGDEVSDLKHAQIGSVRVHGHARAMLYEDRDFHGPSVDFNADVADMKHLPLSGSKAAYEHVGSMRVITDTAFNLQKVYPQGYVIERSKPFGALDSVNEGVCVYEKPNFQGRFQCFASGTDISDLSPGDWKDRISSVRLFGDGRLVGYKDKDFHGERIFIDHDISNLGALSLGAAGTWNHEIASMQIQ